MPGFQRRASPHENWADWIDHQAHSARHAADGLRVALPRQVSSARHALLPPIENAAQVTADFATHRLADLGHSALAAWRQTRRSGRVIAADPLPIIAGVAAIVLIMRLLGSRKTRG